MATRSTIAVELENGTVIQCYCHWDGYLSHNGKLLQTHYNDRDSAEALVQLGDISSLGKRIVPQGEHSFNKPEEDTTVYYGRDRGEKNVGFSTFKNVAEYRKAVDNQEYDYLFTNGFWTVCYGETDGKYILLEDALERDAAQAAE